MWMNELDKFIDYDNMTTTTTTKKVQYNCVVLMFCGVYTQYRDAIFFWDIDIICFIFI